MKKLKKTKKKAETQTVKSKKPRLKKLKQPLGNECREATEM